jgi:hypothetical protein
LTETRDVLSYNENEAKHVSDFVGNGIALEFYFGGTRWSAGLWITHSFTLIGSLN